MPVPSDVLTTQLNPQSPKVGLTASQAADSAAVAAAASASAAAAIQTVINSILGTLAPQATSLTIPAGQIASVALGGTTGQLTISDSNTAGRQCRIHYNKVTPFCVAIDQSHNVDTSAQWAFQTGVIGAVTAGIITVSVNSGDGHLYIGNGNIADITLVISPLVATTLGSVALADLGTLPNVVPTPGATRLLPYVEAGASKVTTAGNLLSADVPSASFKIPSLLSGIARQIQDRAADWLGYIDVNISDDTITSFMKAKRGSRHGQLAHASGYYDRGDGGGGIFWWDINSTAADDAALTFLPAEGSGAGRWRRLVSGVLNAKWFGLKGDGAQVTGAATIANGGTQLTLVGANFKASDANNAKTLILPGATSTGAPLVATIATWISATVVTLSVVASAALAGVSTKVTYYTDDYAKGQAYINYAVNNNYGAYFPPGYYGCTRGWTLNDSASPRVARIEGAGRGYGAAPGPGGVSSFTTFDFQAVFNEPSLRYNNLRTSSIGKFTIVGPNALGASFIDPVPIEPGTSVTQHISSFCRYSRYSSIGGIVGDALCGGAQPDGGYPTLTYTGTNGGSSEVVIEEVSVRNHVVGFLFNPTATGQQGDGIYIDKCRTDGCAIAWA
jgi:hypothetical protein